MQVFSGSDVLKGNSANATASSAEIIRIIGMWPTITSQPAML